MALSTARYEDLRTKVAAAAAVETGHLDALRDEVRAIKPEKLDTRECRAVASLATDGGDNTVMFGPLNLEVLRVVDNHGDELVHEVIAVSDDDRAFRGLADQIPVLQELMDRLEVTFDDLCFALGTQRVASGGRGSDARARLRAFRDLLEWAVLLRFAYQPWPIDMLLLRDGLLRTKTIRRQTFTKLAAAFQQAYDEPAGRGGVFLLGVAKTSAVLSKLGVAMALEGTFDRRWPCWAPVPPTLEARCYNNDWRWMDAKAAAAGDDSECFGLMHLVKLSTSLDAPVLPVDVPHWMDASVKAAALGRLAYDAEQSFPVVGYPAALRAAHEHAELTGMEMVVTGDMMIDALREPLSPAQAERVTRLVHLGRTLVLGGADG